MRPDALITLHRAIATMDLSGMAAWCDELLSSQGPDTVGERVCQSSPSPMAAAPESVDSLDGGTGEFLAEPMCDMHFGSLDGPLSEGKEPTTHLDEDTMLAQEPVAEEGCRTYPWQQDAIYASYCSYIHEGTEPLRKLRGSFQRLPRCASLFGGLNSDRKILGLHGIPTTWLFTCDKKEASIAFSEKNFSRAESHFVDALDFLEIGPDGRQGRGRDLYAKGMARKQLRSWKHLVDVLYVSTSCAPYSVTRTGRRTIGTQGHEDTNLLDTVFVALEEVEPKSVVFEQVYGFCLRESPSQPRSPLQSFLNRLEAKHSQYKAITFLADGKQMLVLLRHRVFVVMIHEDAGGNGSIDILKSVVKAF